MEQEQRQAPPPQQGQQRRQEQQLEDQQPLPQALNPEHQFYERLPDEIMRDEPLHEVLIEQRQQYFAMTRLLFLGQWDECLAASVVGVRQLSNVDDLRCNLLASYVSAVGCEAKLGLQHYGQCATLCSYIIGQTVRVAPMQELQDRLLQLRRLAFELERQRQVADLRTFSQPRPRSAATPAEGPRLVGIHFSRVLHTHTHTTQACPCFVDILTNQRPARACKLIDSPSP